MNYLTGSVRSVLRLEGLAMLVLSIAAYAQWSQRGWGMFVLLFLLPDLSMLGYVRGARLGAAIYNTAHTYVLPAVLGMASVLWLGRFWLAVALIWSAHIALDRLLGYGLKLPESFQATHLGPLGLRAQSPRSRNNLASS